MMRPLLIAIQFLTRIPVPIQLTPKPGELGNSLYFYPLVGLIIGLALCALASLTQNIAPFLAASLIVCLWVLITGGLHIDGVADTVDAWVGGLGSPEKTLAIMQDPACGPMGVMSIVMLLLLKTAAVATLLSHDMIYYLCIAPVTGRTLAIALLAWLPYRRAEGMGKKLTQELQAQKIAGVILLMTLLICAATCWLGLIIVIVSVMLLMLWRRLLLKRLGGCTGDTVGALIEISELTCLFVIVFIAQYT